MQPPDAARAERTGALDRAAAALGVPLAQRQSEQLLAYLALLAKWNRVYNLSAIRDPTEMLVHHVLDSMAAVGPLRRWSQGRAIRLLDVGSGAGLPGIVLAALMPEIDATCVDAVGKKAAFVRDAAASLGLANLHSLHARVEQVGGSTYDVVTSRALASLADFVSMTRHLGGAQAVWMAMKGKPPADEIAALPADIEVFHVERLQVPDLPAERCLVWMRTRREPSDAQGESDSVDK